ncbi:MAG: succinate dehydrogenase assembly factor 4 [Pseudomonadota bacterium]
MKTSKTQEPADDTVKESANGKPEKPEGAENYPEEIGGPSGPEPTRYGDWERKGRCVDF